MTLVPPSQRPLESLTWPVVRDTGPLNLAALAQLARGLAATRASWAPEAALMMASREGRRVLATADYEAWLIAWPVGTSVEPHDHGESAGAFVVCAGELTEVRWNRSVRRTRRLAAGESATIAGGVIHDVIAAGPVTAYSIHAYSPPLTEMRFYDADASQVVAVEPVIEERPILSAGDAAAMLRHSFSAG